MGDQSPQLQSRMKGCRIDSFKDVISTLSARLDIAQQQHQRAERRTIWDLRRKLSSVMKGRSYDDPRSTELARRLAATEADLAQCKRELAESKRRQMTVKSTRNCRGDETDVSDSWNSDAEQILTRLRRSDDEEESVDEWVSDAENKIGDNPDMFPEDDIDVPELDDLAVTIAFDADDDNAAVAPDPFGDGLVEVIQHDTWMGKRPTAQFEPPLNPNITVRSTRRSSCY